MLLIGTDKRSSNRRPPGAYRSVVGKVTLKPDSSQDTSRGKLRATIVGESAFNDGAGVVLFLLALRVGKYLPPWGAKSWVGRRSVVSCFH